MNLTQLQIETLYDLEHSGFFWSGNTMSRLIKKELVENRTATPGCFDLHLTALGKEELNKYERVVTFVRKA